MSQRVFSKWTARVAASCLIAAAVLGASSCLLTTTAPPLEPGLGNVPAANEGIREQIVIDQLRTLKRAEDLYFAQHGKYGSMEDLKQSGAINISPQGLGYTIDLTTTDDGYQIIAVPQLYGPKGRRSFYLDQTGVIRGDDHQGGAASSDDPEVS